MKFHERNVGVAAIAIHLVVGGLVACAGESFAAEAAPSAEPQPLMRDFVGLNVHTVQFKPALFAPVCRMVRDYHPMEWDVGTNTARATSFPFAANGVDWGALYGSWVNAGYEIDACVMFDGLKPAVWKDPAGDARAYGESFARFFGPGAPHPLATSAEIGNEPAKFSASQYRVVFENMARGLRAGDPKLRIATCAVMTGQPDEWSKPMSAIAGLEDLYDVLNIHSYAFKAKWPTWRRSFPEDASIVFLKEIQSVVSWRDEHARGKEIWLTEFGWDSATHPPAPDGAWKDWVGVSDEQQAQYIVRSFLVLSAMPLARAYLYFFNDADEAQLHGASGLTRRFAPKPSFYALAHLYRVLGQCRFARAVARAEAELYCFEYQNAGSPGERVFVAWSPTGAGQSRRQHLQLGAAAARGVYRAERMPTAAGDARQIAWKVAAAGVEIEVGETPIYLWSR